MTQAYSSTEDTQKHIAEVCSLLAKAVNFLHIRAGAHDRSKLKDPEKKVFDEYTPKLRDTTYGSDEYKQYLKEMQAGALDHHYKANRHHPEHFGHGIDNMNLIDLIEMFCDWIAATRRHADGNIEKSIDHNQKRFVISHQLTRILHNTVKMFLSLEEYQRLYADDPPDHSGMVEAIKTVVSEEPKVHQDSLEAFAPGPPDSD